MTTKQLCVGSYSRVRSAAYGAALTPAAPSPAGALKQGHQRFGMTGTDINVWPLSPQDWSTG